MQNFLMLHNLLVHNQHNQAFLSINKTSVMIYDIILNQLPCVSRLNYPSPLLYQTVVLSPRKIGTS